MKNLFKGRIDRRNYIKAQILLFFPYVLLGAFIAAVIGNVDIAKLIVGVLILPITLILMVRRIHDIGASSTPFLIYVAVREIVSFAMLPLSEYIDIVYVTVIFMVINFLIGWYLLLTKGEALINKYGEPTSGLGLKEAIFGISQNTEHPILQLRRKRIKRFGIALILLSLVIFTVLVFYADTAPDTALYGLIVAFFVGIIILLLNRPLSNIYFNENDKSVQSISYNAGSSNKIYLLVVISIISVVAGITAIVLSREKPAQTPPTPTVYDCLKLSSGAARNKCMRYYHPNK